MSVSNYGRFSSGGSFVTCSVLLFAPFGLLLRRAITELLTKDENSIPLLDVLLVNMIASFVLGMVSRVSKKPSTELWLTGLSSGFCGCASTFGGLIYSAAYRFVSDLWGKQYFHCLLYVVIVILGPASSRDAFIRGCHFCDLVRSKKAAPELPVQQQSKQSTVLAILLGVELLLVALVSVGCTDHLSVVYLVGLTYAGAALRVFVSEFLNKKHPNFYVGTCVCNIVGSVLSAVAFVIQQPWKGEEPFPSFSTLLSAVISGFSAAFTTMSTYAKETVHLQEKKYSWFIAYSWFSVLISFVLCILVFSFSSHAFL